MGAPHDAVGIGFPGVLTALEIECRHSLFKVNGVHAYLVIKRSHQCFKRSNSAKQSSERLQACTSKRAWMGDLEGVTAAVMRRPIGNLLRVSDFRTDKLFARPIKLIN